MTPDLYYSCCDGYEIFFLYFLQQVKEAPEWMVKSTVHSDTTPDGESNPDSEVQSQHQAVTGVYMYSNYVTPERK